VSNADISLSRLDIPSHINDCLIPGEVHGISSPSGYKDFPVVSSSCPEAVKIFLASASSGIVQYAQARRDTMIGLRPRDGVVWSSEGTTSPYCAEGEDKLQSVSLSCLS